MHRRSSRATIVALLASLFVAACGPPETDPDALRAADGTPRYRDGEYAAAFSHTDPEGWRPFLRLRVRAGLVEEICFDAVRESGQRLLEAEGYLESYRLETGTVLPDLVAELAASVLERQAPPPPADPGSVGWSAAFAMLVDRALEAARFGVTVGAAGIEMVSAAGPYLATDAPDELGWRAELVVVYDGNGIAAASYSEVRREADGSERMKRDDEAYQERFASVAGTTSAAVAAELERRLIDSDSPAVDVVSGATVTSARFRALAERIDTVRRAVPLPNRLCR